MTRLSRYFPEEGFLVIIMLLATLLRFWGYGSVSYANDELSALIRAQYPTFTELVSKGFYVDGHPGGIQIMLFYWIKLGGTSESWVRIPFILMSIGSVGAAYSLGKLWFHKTTGLFTAACMAFLEYPLIFSRIARPYGPGLLFSLLLLILWTKVVFLKTQRTNRQEYWLAVLLGFAALACMYTHYFSFLLVILVGITGIFFVTPERMKYYLLSVGVAIILFIPHIPITLNHLTFKGVGEWLGKPEAAWMPHYLFQVFNRSWLLIFLIFCILCFAAWKTKNFNWRNPFRWISLGLFMAVFLIAFAYSVWVNPVLQDSVLLFVFPLLLLLIFSFLPNDFNNYLKICLLTFLLIGTVDTIALRHFYSKNHFADFKGVATAINTWTLRCGADKVTTTVVANNPYYLNFYLRNLGGEQKFSQSDNRGGKDIKELINILKTSKTPYFVHAWTKPEPAELKDIILSYYPYVIEDHVFDNLSSATLYGKKCFTGMCKSDSPGLEVSNDFEKTDLWGFDMKYLVSDLIQKANRGIKMDSSSEFGPTYKLNFSDLKLSLPVLVKIEALACLPDSLSDASLVFAMEDSKGKTYNWAASDFSLYLDKKSWGPVYFTTTISEIRSTSDKIAIYVWKPKKGIVYLDNFRIRFYHEPYLN
ncbi:MAG: glycosyltransferase family 39 protein [Bacteroidota bacterium]